MVDAFTTATCHPPTAAGLLDEKAPLLTQAFSCAVQADKERCELGGGVCETIHDGYYIVNMMCVAFGIATFVMYIRPKVLHLQSLPLRAWRLTEGK
jgi:PAT family acetyl-CoA transporter-like MFS transporter 1